MLLSAACARELDVPEANSVAPEIGGKATFTFTPDILRPAGTKALGELPDVKNIYFAVFDAAGYKLAEYAEAVPNSYATTNWDKENPSSADVYSYSVELTITDKPRIVHIIANAPESLPYGTEDEVIGSLYTTLDAPETAKKPDGTTYTGTDRKDAYWCRLYLADGVWPEPDATTSGTDPDYTTKYTKYMGVVNKLKEAQLVRNFTRITMTNYDNDHFQMTGFWLTNVPDLGSVAPYNRNKREFVTDYGKYDNVDELRGTGSDQGNYQGFFPANASLVSIAGTGGWQQSPVASTSALGQSKTSVGPSVKEQNDGASAFCYEREIPKSDPLYIIVEGKYRADAEASWPTTPTYYKIDLKDENVAYFPILRNFNYRINISGVSRSGASTVEGALSAAPSGDISTSLDMQGLTNISDGVSQMFVSETDVVLVGNDDVLLRYKYIPDLGVKVSGDAEVVNGPTDALTDAQLAAVRAWTASTSASDITSLWGTLGESQRMTLWAELDPIVKTHVDAVLTAADSNWKGSGTDKFPYLKALKTGSTTEYVSHYVTISRTPGAAGAVFKTLSDAVDPANGLVVTGTDAADKYREITLKPVAPSAVIKTETVTITGHYWKLEGTVWKESAITRVVTYRLREKLSMSVNCTPTKVPNATGEKIDVMIGLETGLPSSIFSLNMDIEARGLSLTADNKVAGNDLPVNSGTSTITGNTKPGYWFTRTITWTEYENAPVVDGKKWFAASFKTSKVLASDQVYVSNNYFNQANTTYTTYTPRAFSNVRFSGSLAVGSDVDFKFDMAEFTGSSYTVQLAMKGIEPASTETQLSYVGTSDGMEIYTMAVTSNTGNSVKLAPYKSGTDAVSVKILADEYTPQTIKGSPLASPIYLYVDIDHDNAAAIDHVALNGTDVTGKGQLVVGQTGKLTVYITESRSSITIGSLTANRVSTTPTTIDGKSYYAYTTNNNYTAPAKSGIGGAGYDELVVKSGDVTVGSVEIPIWGIQRSTSALGNSAPDVNTWYIFHNNGQNRDAYKNGTTLSLRTTKDDFDALLKFTSSGTTTQIVCASAGQQVVGGASRTNFSFDATGTTYTRGNGVRLSAKNESKTYYWQGNGTTTMRMRDSTTYVDWTLYAVSIVEP